MEPIRHTCARCACMFECTPDENKKCICPMLCIFCDSEGN